MQRLSPFRLMVMLFIGFGASLAYGLLGFGLIFYLESKSNAQLFFAAYTSSFKTIISLGLILGTALIVFLSQKVIPETIEHAFSEEQLSGTHYYYYKKRFSRLRIS